MVLKNSYTCYLLKLGGIGKKKRPNSTFNKHSLSTILHSVIVTSLNFTFTQRFLANFVCIFFPGVYRPVFQVLILFQTKTWRRANFRPTKNTPFLGVVLGLPTHYLVKVESTYCLGFFIS